MVNHSLHCWLNYVLDLSSTVSFLFLRTGYENALQTIAASLKNADRGNNDGVVEKMVQKYVNLEYYHTDFDNDHWLFVCVFCLIIIPKDGLFR